VADLQGEIFDLAGKAGRHFLRLVKDYFWVRISLFIVLCLGIIFVGNNGLGQPPQAITVFSEGKPAHNAKNGFQAIKGMNQAVKEGTLTDPFAEVPKKPSIRASGNQERPDVNVASKANEKGKKSMAKPTLPVLQGIMSGDTRQAVLVEYQGKQYILYVGDSLGHIRLESIGEDKAVWQTPTGEQVMHMHQIGK